MAETQSVDPKARVAALLITLGALLIALLTRIRDLTTYGLWMDEVFSLRIVRQSWAGLFESAVADAVHPPLFYLLLKLWISLGGESLVWLKLLPLLFGLASIGAAYLLIKELKLTAGDTALILIFAAVNAYLIYYAQELRMYSLLMLFSVLSMWAFVRFVNDRGWKPWFVLFVVNLLMVYTHYFGWLTVGAEGVVIIILYRDKLRSFFLQSLGLLLGFLPWAIAVARAISERGTIEGNVAWIDRPPIMAIPVFLADIVGNFGGVRNTIALGMIVFLTPVAIWLWQNRNDQETRKLAVLLGSLTFVPIIAAFLLSQITATSVWVDRYFIATAIPFLLLLAIAAVRVRPRAVSVTFLVLMIGWSLGAGAWNIFARQERVNWKSLAERLSASPAGPVYTNDRWIELPLTEAMNRAGKPTNVTVLETPTAAPEKEFWFAYRTSTWTNAHTPHEIFASKGCSIDEELADRTSFENVHVIRVECAYQ